MGTEGDPRAGLKKGHLSFTLVGERLKGGWDLIRMHGEANAKTGCLSKRKMMKPKKGEGEISG